MTAIDMPPPRIGRVSLSVADLDRSIRFYEDAIGLTLQRHDGELAQMGAGDETLLMLTGQPGARSFNRAPGLYHFAILLPSRGELGRTLRHLIKVDAPISGFADHLVSEAIYLTDPDGHGIEIYRDRPRDEWHYPGGQLKMTTDPIDLQGIAAAAVAAAGHAMPAGTFVGHIHLQVANIPDTEAFYNKMIGFDVVTRYGPRATFMSANGYHHHLGGNTWAGENLPPAPDDAARLLWYEIRLPDGEALRAAADRLSAANYPFDRGEGGLWVNDPSEIRILLTTGE
jgi:catechol 2,3-dioxygenase